MFKFIHCADLHLDSPLRGLAEKIDAPVDEIRSATRKALINLVNLSIEENVDFVLIAGDVYDGDWQDYSTGLFFNNQMARLRQYGIPVYLIRGNHDAQSLISKRLTPPDNVYEFSVDKPETKLIEKLQVAIHGQGYKEREVWHNMALDYPDSIPGFFNIGLLHTSLEGQEGHERYAPAKIDELVQKGYDYWALGHIHKRQVLHENPYIIFPGNIQGRHIRETGDKGCTLVTVNGTQVSIEHRSLDVLRWIPLTVELSNVEDEDAFITELENKMQNLIGEHIGYPLAVRIILTGKTSLHSDFLHERERFVNEVINQANMVSQRIWIEKIKFETEPEQDLTYNSARHDALAALIQNADFTNLEDEFLDEFLSHVKKVQSRMSGYTRREDATKIEDVEDLKPLIKDAQDLLLGLIGKGASRS